MPMTRWDFRNVPCLAGGNASTTCLNMLVMRFADVQWPAPLSLLLHFATQYKSLVIIIHWSSLINDYYHHQSLHSLPFYLNTFMLAHVRRQRPIIEYTKMWLTIWVLKNLSKYWKIKDSTSDQFFESDLGNKFRLKETNLKMEKKEKRRSYSHRLDQRYYKPR